MDTTHKLHICSTCQKDPQTDPRGETLAAELRDLFANSDDADIRAISIETVECMSMCDTPTALSFRASDKAAYLFSGIDPTADHDDILAFAKLYTASADGWIDDARPCGRLRFCLTGRIPA